MHRRKPEINTPMLLHIAPLYYLLKGSSGTVTKHLPRRSLERKLDVKVLESEYRDKCSGQR